MATWMMHFRVADYFKNQLDVEEVPFYVGNIGPDCGEWTGGEWGAYNPPSTITHWREESCEEGIDAEAFFQTYLTRIGRFSKKQISFYIGYYIHLLTDIQFSKHISKPSMKKYKESLAKDPQFKWVITKDWYDLEHLFLRENPNFPPFKCVEKIEKFPNDYLAYYSDTAIIKQVKHLTQFYQKSGEELDREYLYLTKAEADTFIEKTCEIIEQQLKEKQIFLNK